MLGTGSSLESFPHHEGARGGSGYLENSRAVCEEAVPSLQQISMLTSLSSLLVLFVAWHFGVLSGY